MTDQHGRRDVSFEPENGRFFPGQRDVFPLERQEGFIGEFSCHGLLRQTGHQLVSLSGKGDLSPGIGCPKPLIEKAA